MTETRIPYFSPLLEVRHVDEKGGSGVFARQPIPAGEHLVTWGGEIIDWAALQRLPHDVQSRKTVQIEENQFLLTVGDPDPGDYVNHSCNPNAGLKDCNVLVAMRDIAVGEEVCIDYAMCDGTPYDEFECACGAPNCRGHFTGNDWRLPELWTRYAGYFSPYLQRRIAKLART